MEKIKLWLNAWIDKTPGLRERLNRLLFRLKLAAGAVVGLFVAWHGFLFYLDRPIEHAVQIEIAKPSEAMEAPEVVLGDGQPKPKTTAGAKPVLPTASATPVLPVDVQAVTAAPVVVAAPAPAATPPPVAATPAPTPAKEETVKILVSNKAKFPKGINSKKALEFFKKKLESDHSCFTKTTGTKQLTALIKTSATGSVLAVTLKPVAVKEKRKIASVVKEWTPTSVCLKKHLDKAPLLKTKNKKPSVSELILKFE